MSGPIIDYMPPNRGVAGGLPPIPAGFELVGTPADFAIPDGFEPIEPDTRPPASDLPEVSPWDDPVSKGVQALASRVPELAFKGLAAVDVGAKKLAELTGVSGVRFGEDWMPQLVPTTPEYLAQPTPWMEGAQAIRQRVQDAIGYAPGTTLEDVLTDWSRVPAFAVEQGIGSVPDMAAAVTAPWLYGAARTGEIATNRAAADGRANAPTLEDILVAAPAAAVGTALERVGIGKMLEPAGAGVGAAARRIGGTALAEGAGEAIDEGGEYLATNAGTKTGANPVDLGKAMLGGAIVGGPIGGAVRGAHEAGAALARNLAPPAGFEPVGEEAQAGPTAETMQPQPQQEAQPQPDAQATAPETPQPATNRVSMKTPDGAVSVDGEYQVVDLKNLQRASGDLQPRDRERAASDAQIAQIAGNLDPERLLASQETDRGAPIVDENGTILSGNGRTAAIELAKSTNPEGYARYQQAIGAYGDTSGMDTPVLVRRVSGLTPEAKRDFVVRSNKDDKIAMSPAEQAGVDADLVDAGALDTLNPDFEIGAIGNRDFVRSVLRRLPAGEQAAFVNADGQLHPQGAKRIEAAIFSRAYGDRDLTNRIVEDGTETAGTARALLAAAPAWAQMRARAPSQFDITEQLVAAINALSEMRRAKQKPDTFFAQQDAFQKTAPEVEALARAFWNSAGTRAAAWGDVRDFLRNYAEAASNQANATGDLLGGAPQTPGDILRGMLDTRQRRASAEAETRASQGNLFQGQPNRGNVTAPAIAAEERTADTVGSRVRQATRAPDVQDTVQDPTEQVQDTTDQVEPGAASEADLDRPEEDLQLDLLKNSRVPRSGLSPTFEDVSFSKGASPHEQAFRDAGIDPERGRLMPPVRQLAVLSDLLKRAFGFGEVNDNGIKALDGIDQMLDGYRNLQFMAHALGMPNTAFGLGGRVRLALESFNGRYLGAYSPGDYTIHMPGRSNSFAHEWAHALDHYLLDTLGTKTGQAAQNYLYSHETRSEGLDPTQSVPHAFVNLMNRIFFDDAALAARVAKLQVEAAKVNKRTGQPTQAALQAQAQLDKIAEGNAKPRGVDSQYATKARNFDGSGYWQRPTEMLARAFEAYVAHKVELAGGTNQFITKSDEAYLNNADRRLRETFPKDQERRSIFQAFDDLIGQIQAAQLLGVDPVAGKPADTDIVDPMHWFKVGLGIMPQSIPAQLRQELTALGAAIRRPIAALKASASEIAIRAGLNARPSLTPDFNVLRRTADVGRFIGYSMRGMMKTFVSRAPKEAKPYLQAVTDMFATDPGSGREIAETYEAAVERTARRDTNELSNILKANGLGQTLRPDQVDRLRGLMLGENVAGATRAEVSAAAGMRRMLNRLWRENTEAGIEMGFVKDTGYLTRILKQEAVFTDPDGFQNRASQVYEIVFDNDVRANGGNVDPNELAQKIAQVRGFAPDRLAAQAIRDAMKTLKTLRAELRKLQNATPQDTKAIAAKEAEVDQALHDLADLIQPEWAAVAAQKWKEAILQGSPFDFNVRGPEANFTKSRVLPPEADRIMEPFYIENPVEAVAHYAMQSARKREFVRRAGSPTSSVDDLDIFARRPAIQDEIRANPRRYSTATPEGRINIIRDLTNPATDNRIEMLFKEAIRNKANPEDVRGIRGMVERISGRTLGVDAAPLRRFSSFFYTAGTLALMPRAMWSSVAEPVAVFMQTRSTRVMLKTFAAYVSEIKRSDPTVRQLAALSEAIGLVTSPYYEGLIHHSMEGTYGDSLKTQRLLSNFFMRTGLTHLTNAQRRASLAGGYLYMTELANAVQGGPAGPAGKIQADIARAELRDLGIPERLVDDFAKWIIGLKGLPSLDDLNTPAGQLFAAAANRFVDQTIQAPKRVDKPALASSSWGRLAYGITSFNYAFTRSTHFKQLIRTGRDAQIMQDAGMSRGAALTQAAAGATGTLALGFAMLVIAQTLGSVIREALFNGEKWDEMEAKGELVSWLLQLGLSRSGITGTLDPLLQAKTGLRYERDLTGLAVGPHFGYFLNGAQGMLGMYAGRNSPNSNTAEWNAAKSGYQVLAVPAISLAMTSLPGGPMTGSALGLAMQKLTSNQAADQFANLITGEKDSRRKYRERAAAQALGGF